MAKFLRRPDNPDRPLNPKGEQYKFATSESFITVAFGGWGSRKTWAGVAFCWQSIMLNPGSTGIVIAPTYQMTRELVNKYLKTGLRDLIINESQRDNTLYLRDGGRIIYLSGHVPERIQMYTAAWAYMDEVALMQKIAYTNIIGRIRDPNVPKRRLGMTSLPLWGWMRDEFCDPKPNQTILHWRTEDNIDLTPETIQDFKVNCPAKLAECFLGGKFVAPGGSVYPEFGDQHITDWQPPRGKPIGIAIDFSPRTPHVLFADVLLERPSDWLGPFPPEGAVVVLDELFPDGLVTTERLAQLILAKNWPIAWICPDPAGMSVEATSGSSECNIIQRLIRAPMKWTKDPVTANVANGIGLVRRMFDPISGPPRLYVHRNLFNNKNPRALVNALRAYSYPQDKAGRASNDMPVKDGISDHACDCLRYIVINFFPYSRLRVVVRNAG